MFKLYGIGFFFVIFMGNLNLCLYVVSNLLFFVCVKYNGVDRKIDIMGLGFFIKLYMVF